MKIRYLGVIVFPVVAISVATVVVNGIGVLIAGGTEREPTTTNRIISLLIGLMTMLTLYSMPAFKRWIPNKRNLGRQIWVAIVAIISTVVAGYLVYTNVVNEAFRWTTSPAWLDGKQVVRGMCIAVLTAWWFLKRA